MKFAFVRRFASAIHLEFDVLPRSWQHVELMEDGASGLSIGRQSNQSL